MCLDRGRRHVRAGREAPGAADEHADAEAVALRAGERLHALLPRRDLLLAVAVDADIGVGEAPRPVVPGEREIGQRVLVDGGGLGEGLHQAGSRRRPGRAAVRQEAAPGKYWRRVQHRRFPLAPRQEDVAVRQAPCRRRSRRSADRGVDGDELGAVGEGGLDLDVVDHLGDALHALAAGDDVGAGCIRSAAERPSRRALDDIVGDERDGFRVVEPDPRERRPRATMAASERGLVLFAGGQAIGGLTSCQTRGEGCGAEDPDEKAVGAARQG